MTGIIFLGIGLILFGFYQAHQADRPTILIGGDIPLPGVAAPPAAPAATPAATPAPVVTPPPAPVVAPVPVAPAATPDPEWYERLAHATGENLLIIIAAAVLVAIFGTWFLRGLGALKASTGGWLAKIFAILALCVLVLVMTDILLTGGRFIMKAHNAGVAGWNNTWSAMFREDTPPSTTARFTRGGPTVLPLTIRPDQTAMAMNFGRDHVQFCLIYTEADQAALRPRLGRETVGTARPTGPEAREWTAHPAVTQYFTRQGRPLELRVHRIAPSSPPPC